MERLTYYHMKGSENDGYYLKPRVSQRSAVDRLAAYENAQRIVEDKINEFGNSHDMVGENIKGMVDGYREVLSLLEELSNNNAKEIMDGKMLTGWISVEDEKE